MKNNKKKQRKKDNNHYKKNRLKKYFNCIAKEKFKKNASIIISFFKVLLFYLIMIGSLKVILYIMSYFFSAFEGQKIDSSIFYEMVIISFIIILGILAVILITGYFTLKFIKTAKMNDINKNLYELELTEKAYKLGLELNRRNELDDEDRKIFESIVVERGKIIEIQKKVASVKNTITNPIKRTIKRISSFIYSNKCRQVLLSLIATVILLTTHDLCKVNSICKTIGCSVLAILTLSTYLKSDDIKCSKISALINLLFLSVLAYLCIAIVCTNVKTINDIFKLNTTPINILNLFIQTVSVMSIMMSFFKAHENNY